MKDLYQNPVLAEWRERHQKGDVTPQWVIDHVMPEVNQLLAMGHATLEASHEGFIMRPIEEGRVYYPVPDTMPGPEEMCTHFIGSGALSYSWWDVEPDGWINFDDGLGIIHPEWEIRVVFGDDDFEEGTKGVINPASLAQAIMRIKSGVTSVRSYVVDQCAMFAAGNLDDVDFDAADADSVMQIAITGDDHIYG